LLTEKIAPIQDLIIKTYSPKLPRFDRLSVEARRRTQAEKIAFWGSKIVLSSGLKATFDQDNLVMEYVAPTGPKAVIVARGRDWLRVPQSNAPSQALGQHVAERHLSQLVLPDQILIALAHIQRPVALDDELKEADDRRFGEASDINAQVSQFLRNEVIGNLGNFVQRIREVRRTGGIMKLSAEREDGSTGFLGILANHLHSTLLLDVTYSRQWLDMLYEELRGALSGAVFRSSWGRLFLRDGHIAVDFAPIPSVPESEEDDVTFRRWVTDPESEKDRLVF